MLLVLARTPRRLIRQWRTHEDQQQATSNADLLDQRVLRDTAPSLLRKEKADAMAMPGRARLIIKEASGNSDAITLADKPVTLGTDHTCEVVLEADGGLIAAAHAQIWLTGNRFAIRSLNPRYATRVGGSKVNWAMLDDGDEIEIGRCRIRFEATHASEPVPDYLSLHHSHH